MAFIAGIDPGINGAVAVYDTDTRRLISVEDMPTWVQVINKKKRKRIDPIALKDMFDTLMLLGVDLVVIEAVGGRPKQGAAAGFQFGHVVGMIYMALIYSKLMVETVPPTQWKKLLKVPGKAGGKDKTNAEKKLAEQAIMARANELFPHDRDSFRTPRGAYRMDRAEAAMLAKFGGEFVLRTMQPADDERLADLYRNAETGA